MSMAGAWNRNDIRRPRQNPGDRERRWGHPYKKVEVMAELASPAGPADPPRIPCSA
jgi:hypothetical protein